MPSIFPQRDSVKPPAPISLAQASRVWARIGWLSFGGPAGQIALMHRELVERRRWISESRFLHALNYCMLLPGPEATQLAIYIGWLMHRTRGGLIAGLLFVLPGVIVLFGLSALYASMGQLPMVLAIFFGLKAAVLAVVVEAVWRIAHRALKGRFHVAVAMAAFLGIHLFGLPFPWIVAGAGGLGFAAHRWWPQRATEPVVELPEGDNYLIDQMLSRGELTHLKPSWARSWRVALVGVTLWMTPVFLAIAWWGRHSVIAREGSFFSEVAVVTFGGAYAVLAFISQRVVTGYGWLSPGQMLDGLALAETTPGPLIMVVQFVAFMAAFQHQTGMSPWLAGITGSLLTVWVTFVPCFLWVLLGGPYVEALRGNRGLHAALSAVTAAVVGVILNLSIWFAEHTIFSQVQRYHAGPIHLDLPQLASVNPAALLLAAAAMLAMFRFRIGMAWTLGLCASVSVLIHLLAV